MGCGLAWVFRAVGVFHQGPVSELPCSRRLWAARTHAGPSSQKGPLPYGPAPVWGKPASHCPSSLSPDFADALGGPLLISLWSLSPLPCALCSGQKMLSHCSWPQGVQAHLWTGGAVCGVAATSAPLGALSRYWGAGDQGLKIQMSGGRGQGSQATSSPAPSFHSWLVAHSGQPAGWQPGSISCQDPPWLGSSPSLSLGMS